MANEDPFLPQRVQRAYEEFTLRLRDDDVKRQVLARLIKDGFLNDDDWKHANKMAIQFYITEKESEAKTTKEAEETKKAYEAPDSKIPRMWPHRNTQGTAIGNYVSTCGFEALQKYLADLKARPMHYHSLYPRGELAILTDYLENVLKNRSNTAAKSAKPEPNQPSKPESPINQYTT